MKKINNVLLNPYASFDEWEKAVESISDTTEKGDAMEHLTYFYLKSNSAYYNIKDIYMEDEIPDDLRAKLKLERKDNGVDGVIVRNDGTTVAYQVKFRSNHGVPTAQELSTFWAESEYADYRLICANCAALPKVSSKKKQQMSILLDTYMKLDKDFFDAFLEYLKSKRITLKHKKATPDGDHQYQADLINKIIDGLSKNDRGKFIAACGIGKTLIAMWVQENIKAKTVLFVVPSLALIKQTLDSWVSNCNIPFSYLCVCSDSTVASSQEDDINILSSDVDFPVTTAPGEIQKFLSSDVDKKIVFCTYNSLDAISNALTDTDYSFDIGFFDEAHRTAGTKDSLMFVYGMEDKYIPITKRLFMTATERLVSPRLKNSLSDYDNDVLFSMDDESKYGPTLASLNFGEAIEKGIICDYRIVLCTITENDIANLVSGRKIVTTELGDEESSANIDVLLKEVLIAKVMKELDVRKVISYHASVKNAKTFVNGSNGIHAVGNIIDDVLSETSSVPTFTSHINGTMSAGERKKILSEFATSKRGLISNAKCLTEGVDVPAIDAVYFVDPKNSMVDIVQAVGRALRKSKTKSSDCSYIIIPVVIPNNASLFSNVAPSNFDTLHNVIQAMRAQDAKLADIIDQINFSAATGSLGGAKGAISSKIIFMPYSKISINDFEESLTLRIAEVNKNPTNTSNTSIWNETAPKARKSEVKRVFVSIGDYSLDAYFDSLVLPTLKKFTNSNLEMSGKELTINNNNVSHAVRMGVISKNDEKYKMTPLGILLLSNPGIFSSIAKEQLLKYYCFNEENSSILFPYRALLKIFLEYDYITRFEFFYCIYSLKSTDDDAIKEAIERIQYLRDTYPNIGILSEANKEKVLDLLNTKYDIQFGFKEIWSSRTTTYNQFNYFKKHLWSFSNIFDTKENGNTDIKRIKISVGVQSAIKELLDMTADVETTAKSRDLDRLEKLYTTRVYPGII